MSRPVMKRALAALRRLLRRKRAPSPSEQEWLRMILLVRKLQHGQLAFAQRLDDVRALTGSLGSFRSDFSELHAQLGAARESAGELERGLSARLARLDGLPDPEHERADVDRRLARMEGLAARLETLAAQAAAVPGRQAEHEALLARLADVATRLESAPEAERSLVGQAELARLHARIQELAESLATRPAAAGAAADAESGVARAFGEHVQRLGEQLESLDCALEALGSGDSLQVLGETLARLEQLARRFEKKSGELRAGILTSGEMAALLARFEGLAERLEQLPAALPELPGDATPGTLDLASASRELNELHAALLCEQESRARTEEELVALQEKLRASELARVELETRHATELTQMADHVQRQLARVEDDLKKKKRGLSELTQQNIALQNQLARLTAGTPPAEPGAPLPHGSGAPLARLMQPDARAEEAGADEPA